MWYLRDKGNAAIQSDFQAILYSEYLEALVAGLDGSECVVTGCAVTAQGTPDMTVAVASGTVLTGGVQKAVSAGNVTVTTADATNPRLDLIVVDSSGSKTIRTGTAAATPAPVERTDGDVILAVVYVPASDTTISSTQIVDLRATRTMIVAAAGTAARPPLQLTSGTNSTTAVGGAVEYDGKVGYFSPEGSNRGVMLAEYFICLSSTNTLTSQTGQQPIFDSVGGGTLTLPTGLYFFECLLSVNTMSSTSGNMGFDLKGSGTATVGSILYHAVGIDGNTGTAATQTGSTSVASASPASIVTAGTGTACNVSIRGTFRVTAAGTIIPGLSQVTAAAAVVAIGSYFRCRCVGSSTVQTCGQWS